MWYDISSDKLKLTHFYWSKLALLVCAWSLYRWLIFIQTMYIIIVRRRKNVPTQTNTYEEVNQQQTAWSTNNHHYCLLTIHYNNIFHCALLINKHPTISITLHIRYFTTRVQKERAQNSDAINYQQSLKNSRVWGHLCPKNTSYW
jgi:hypothetical protein